MVRINKIAWTIFVFSLVMPLSSALCSMGNCPMTAYSNEAARQESLPQSPASQSTQYPCSVLSQTILQGMTGQNSRVSGVRRIYPKNVLDHPQRKEIYNFITTNPGIDLEKIGKALGLNRETLRYHLNLLTSSNKIVIMKDHGIVRYFENHGRFCILERRVLAHLWNPTAEQILSIVQSNPGITQGDIASQLSLASPSVHWYMQRLTEDGIVKTQRTGRLTNYSITEEAFQVFNNPAGIRQCIPFLGDRLTN
jgi:predicted transcriptional regulator